jgi:hypothetical protein
MLHNIIIGLLVVVLFAEYILPIKDIWKRVGFKFKAFGEWFFEYENQLYSIKEEWEEGKEVKLKLNNFFARIIFFSAATIVVILLEIFWELGFKGVSNKFKKSKFAAWAEKKIKTLPNWAVLILFGAPFIAMELLGIIAVATMLSGHVFLGITLYLFKVLFFIPVHFVLHVGEEQLMQIAWFRRRYNIIKAVLDWFKKSQSYVKVHNISETIAAYIRAVKDLFLKAVIHMKKAFEGEDILSEECEQIRQEILKIQKETGKEAKKRIYVELFKCINKHISKAKGENYETLKKRKP